MKKRILITSTDLMMVQFLLPHVRNLSENGFEVDVACSDVGGRINEIREKLEKTVENIYVVRLHRSPVKPGNTKGYKDLKKIIDGSKYDIIWTNEPVMGVMTRLAAKKARRKGTMVLYMAHGFHFFKGSSKLSWLVYYHIEKLMASKSDVICTINQEDYKRTKTFNVGRVEYIHGIGINTERLTQNNEKNDIRSELGLRRDDFIVLSVGELNKNKNHRVIIKAIKTIDDTDIHYIICGKGDQLGKLKLLVKDLGLGDRVHFMGYRKDVVDICSQADVFAFPSKREGLGLAALEAMYTGLPLLTSYNRGAVDFMSNGHTGYMYQSDDVCGFANGIRELKENPDIRNKMGKRNKVVVEPYCIDNVKKEIVDLLQDILLE